MKKLRLLAAMLAMLALAVVPAIAQVGQEGEQDADSADLDQAVDITGGGANSNQCVGAQQAGNTGESQNQLDLVQYASTADDFEFEEVGSTITASPANTTSCDQQVNQAASAAS